MAAGLVPQIIRERGIDFCVINGENSAGGFGITEASAGKLFSYGADVITTGNHVWDRQDTDTLLDSQSTILRPANYPPGVRGRGQVVAESRDGLKVGVLNLQGRIFMSAIDCPFRTADRIVDEMRLETSIIFVDFHAEATSEKMALGRYLDGRVSAVVGTHTHVMTADETILKGGTAYLTDAGMTGPHESIIGVRVEQSMARIIKQIPVRFSPASNDLRLSGVIIEVNPSTGKAESIERLHVKYADHE